jgi:hypothetical protein
MDSSRQVLVLLAILMLCAGCTGTPGERVKAPIILGDSSTIVTERDPRYLSDFVDDIDRGQLVAGPKNGVDSANAANGQDTTKTTGPQEIKPAENTSAQNPVSPSPEPSGKGGFDLAFKEVTVRISDIATRSYKTQNPANSNGVTFELTGGNLTKSKIIIERGNNVRISQRYATTVVIAANGQKLELSSLGITTDWKPLAGKGPTYLPSGLDGRNLQTKNANAAELRNSINRAARSRRLSKAQQQAWDKTARQVRNLQDGHFATQLRSVMWKIDGKDEKGKSFSKQVRLDVPVEL